MTLDTKLPISALPDQLVASGLKHIAVQRNIWPRKSSATLIMEYRWIYGP